MFRILKKKTLTMWKYGQTDKNQSSDFNKQINDTRRNNKDVTY